MTALLVVAALLAQLFAGPTATGHVSHALPAAIPVTSSVTLSPTTTANRQARLDAGRLVTWFTSPSCLLAGHDSMGWAWLDNIATGTVVNVKTGPCKGRYKVVGHKWQARKGGPVPAWFSHYALVLQTCTGAVGVGFSVAQRY